MACDSYGCHILQQCAHAAQKVLKFRTATPRPESFSLTRSATAACVRFARPDPSNFVHRRLPETRINSLPGYRPLWKSTNSRVLTLCVQMALNSGNCVQEASKDQEQYVTRMQAFVEELK